MRPITIRIDPPTTFCEIEFPRSFDALEKLLRFSVGSRKFLVVTDKNVVKFCPFIQRFSKNELLILPVGEKEKTWKTTEKILDTCFRKRFDRHSLLISVGGGVVGDVTGLAASLYMRGTPVIHIPTTLLGMVDSSLGGKTGIDCQYGKNLIGTIHHPEKVFACEEFLTTLPESELKNGLCEMIKHGIITSPRHFKDLEKLALLSHKKGGLKGVLPQLIPLIRDSIEIKSRIVERDERGKDIRMQLNFGHTFGHAIELLSGFTIPHGRAVAIGMLMATNYALKNKLCGEETADRIENILNQFEIDTTCDIGEKKIWEAMKHDKKCFDGRIRLILPRKIGVVEVHSV
ncbi:3-dehydroquinate synthase [Candidatus Gracilibacteria bacterium]|nr:3-dehydroquinate synthase [Candidatus Gracilibacteria bacterium]